MKKTWKNVLCAALSGTMLLGSVPLAGAAYEEYLPTITRLEEQNGEAYYYYTVPFEGDAFQYGFLNSSENMGMGTWWSENWEAAGTEQSMSVFLSGEIEEGTYPIVAELREYAGGDIDLSLEPIARRETGFYVDITVLPALETRDITFVRSENSYNVTWEDGSVTEEWDWTADLGEGYPAGRYTVYDVSASEKGILIGYVYDENEQLVINGRYGVENGTISKENLVFQRCVCTGISADGKTAYMEVTQAQHMDGDAVEPDQPAEESASSYIYDEPDPGESIDFSGMLDDVDDEASAVDAVEQAAADLTDEQKQSETGIDKLTLLAEEAAAKATTVSASGGEVNVAAANVSSDVGSALSATTGALSDAGITTQRNARTILNYDAGSSETVSVTTEALPETVDRVRVTTDYAAATVDAQQASSFTMTDRGSRTVEVNFDTDSETMVTVSFPGMSMDETYVAVVDEEGNPVGGKYNPATGTLEAKLTESGVYQVVNNEKDFADIKAKSQEMQEAIKLLASKGIINGTTETMFEPDSTISRAEVTALLMRTLSLLDPNADGGFADVTPQNWYYGAAGSAKEHNIINGFEDNTFRGDAVIAKDQIVSVSARTLREQMDYKTPSDVTGELSIYTDAGSIANWAREDVALATMTNLVLKRMDGKFDGSAGMTRGDAAIIVKRLFDKLW